MTPAEFILDTDHWSFVMRGRAAVLAALRERRPAASARMSAVALGELLAGIEKLSDGRRKRDLQRKFDEIVTLAGEPLPVTADVAADYARIIAHLRRTGRPIPTNDLWIAATARQRGATLVSHDAHFRDVPGLTVEDWTS